MSKPNKIKLKPDCLMSLGLTMMITNTGHLLPCGQLFVGQGIRDPKVKELMKYTKISDYDSMDDIINHPKWIEHFENLKNDEGPDRCFFCCKADNKFNKHSMWEITDSTGNKVVEK